MAKVGKGKKDKAEKGAARKVKAPKQPGTGKVPKKLRKLGDQAVKLAKEPVVAEVVAGALLAAAAALREGKDPKGTVGAALKGGMKSAVGKGKGSAAGGAEAPRLSDSLKLIALDFARRALEPKGEAKAQKDAQRAADPATDAKTLQAGEVRQAEAGPAAEHIGGRGG